MQVTLKLLSIHRLLEEKRNKDITIFHDKDNFTVHMYYCIDNPYIDKNYVFTYLFKNKKNVH